MSTNKVTDFLDKFLFFTILQRIQIMSDKIDALVAADTALALAVHDALDKIAAAVDAVNTAAADEVAISDATATITAQVDALRAVVPVV